MNPNLKGRRWAVIYRTWYTQSQRGAPEWFDTEAAAEQKARDFNRFNQDRTWNAVTAYVIDTRVNAPN